MFGARHISSPRAVQAAREAVKARTNERIRKALELRKAGKTLKEIGAEIGRSRLVIRMYFTQAPERLGIDRTEVFPNQPELHAKALEIGRQVAEAHKRSMVEILSPCRARPLPQIRWEIWHRCKHDLKLGRYVIGKLFNRDPQTIYHGIKAQTKKIERAKRLKAMGAAYPQAVASPRPTA